MVPDHGPIRMILSILMYGKLSKYGTVFKLQLHQYFQEFFTYYSLGLAQLQSNLC